MDLNILTIPGVVKQMMQAACEDYHTEVFEGLQGSAGLTATRNHIRSTFSLFSFSG